MSRATETEMLKISSELESGESVLHEEGVSHVHNFVAVGGMLCLTSKRILFRSSANTHYKHEIIITLDQVAGVEFFRSMFMNPNGIALMLKNGQIENFIVDDKKGLRKRIQTLIGG